MKRPWHVWVIFLGSLAAIVVGMAWLTIVGLELDEREQHAQTRREWEEDVRLALWRMDSYLTTMISAEASRPYFVYSAAYPPYRAYAYMFTEDARSKNSAHDLLMPSPLLLTTPPHVILHFQVTEDHIVSSPQAPSPEVCAMLQLDSQFATPERWDEAAQQLAQLELGMDWDLIADYAPTELSAPGGPLMAAGGGGQTAALPQSDGPYQSGVQTADGFPPVRVPPQQVGRSRDTQVAQQRLSQQEFSNRYNSAQNAIEDNLANNSITTDDVRASVMRPAWLADRLFLLRRVQANSEEYIQGAWLNWDSLRRSLLGLVADVFPEAELAGVLEHPTTGVEGSERMLAVIPARLVPGELSLPPLRAWTPIRIALAAAWICMLLAAAVVAALLLGVMRLSERRATFVSAVTHELRTPLTTFRMYSEMLSSGMVTGEERKKQYMETLRLEADRLGHLVENVLSFAQLEKANSKQRTVPISVNELMSKVVPRLEDRASRSEMELEVEIPAEEWPNIKTEPGAAEQVLLNLVDNACKYASSARPALIHIGVTRGESGVEIRVSDHGPGISRHESRLLFRPFTKSASDAAHSAPGVGLGLALSRRLARQVGGRLRLDHTYSQGACFVLTLPWA